MAQLGNWGLLRIVVLSLVSQNDVAVLKQQLQGILEGFEHACGQTRITAGTHLLCNPAPLFGNAPHAFG